MDEKQPSPPIIEGEPDKKNPVRQLIKKLAEKLGFPYATLRGKREGIPISWEALRDRVEQLGKIAHNRGGYDEDFCTSAIALRVIGKRLIEDHKADSSVGFENERIEFQSLVAQFRDLYGMK